MPRSLFARLFLHTALAVLAFLAAAGFTTDRYLARWEIRQLEHRLEAVARVTALGLPGNPSELGSLVEAAAEASGVRLTVIGRDGTVRADSHKDPHRMENHATRPEIAEALSGAVGISQRISPTLGLPMLYVAVPGNPVVRAAMPASDVRDLLARIRRRLMAAATPAFALALLLALGLARGLTRRFERMDRFAARVASGDFEAELPARGDDDLASLERGLGHLRDALSREVVSLRRDRKRLADLVQEIPDGIVVLDAQGQITLANPMARTLLRVSDLDVPVPGAEWLRHPTLLEALDRAQKDQSVPSEPLALEWPEPKRHLLALLVPLPDHRGRPGTLVVFHDVTRERELERLRRDFVANTSHELRTPLTAIRGAAETVINAGERDPAAARRFLETIHRNALRLESLLKDITDLARLEAGAAESTPRAFDARTPVEQVVDMFRTEAERRGVHLETRLPTEPIPVTADPEPVESVLVNLVQNAVRYTPAGGRACLAVETTPDGGVLYRVEDTGIGIPPRDLPRVTERFYRVDPARSRATGGTGLGLSIVKHLVESLGGTLSIESEAGLGTRVTVTLPQDPPG